MMSSRGHPKRERVTEAESVRLGKTLPAEAGIIGSAGQRHSGLTKAALCRLQPLWTSEGVILEVQSVVRVLGERDDVKYWTVPRERERENGLTKYDSSFKHPHCSQDITLQLNAMR